MMMIDRFLQRFDISRALGHSMRVLFLIVSVSGCGKGPAKDEFLTPQQTPDQITEAAAKVFPGIVFEQVWKYEENGETRYEIRGKTPDKQWREVTVSAEGKVLWPVQPE